jgi:hypothetical protein
MISYTILTGKPVGKPIKKRDINMREMSGTQTVGITSGWYWLRIMSDVGHFLLVVLDLRVLLPQCSYNRSLITGITFYGTSPLEPTAKPTTLCNV